MVAGTSKKPYFADCCFIQVGLLPNFLSVHIILGKKRKKLPNEFESYCLKKLWCYTGNMKVCCRFLARRFVSNF